MGLIEFDIFQPTAPTDPKTAFAHPILGIMVMAFCLANVSLNFMLTNQSTGPKL